MITLACRLTNYTGPKPQNSAAEVNSAMNSSPADCLFRLVNSFPKAQISAAGMDSAAEELPLE